MIIKNKHKFIVQFYWQRSRITLCHSGFYYQTRSSGAEGRRRFMSTLSAFWGCPIQTADSSTFSPSVRLRYCFCALRGKKTQAPICPPEAPKGKRAPGLQAGKTKQTRVTSRPKGKWTRSPTRQAVRLTRGERFGTRGQ